MQTLSLCTAIPGVQTPPFAEKPPQAPRYGVHVTLNRKLPLYPEYRLPQEAFPDCSVKSYAHTARSFQVLQTLPRLKLCFPRSRDCDRDATPAPDLPGRAGPQGAGVQAWAAHVSPWGGGGGGMANASCRESCWDRLELRLVLHAALPFPGRCPKDTPAARCRCERTRPFTPTPFVTAKHQKRPESRESCCGRTAGSGAAVKRNGDSLHELAGRDFQNVPLNEESQNAQRAPGHNNENPVTCRLPPAADSPRLRDAHRWKGSSRCSLQAPGNHTGRG